MQLRIPTREIRDLKLKIDINRVESIPLIVFRRNQNVMLWFAKLLISLVSGHYYRMIGRGVC